MDWISWSRTWSTKSTTTTSRRPLRPRWKRMYLLVQADQRLKQNHEDPPLLAHPQELCLSVKDVGLILSQELTRISLSQCQNDWLLFFVMVSFTTRRRWSDWILEVKRLIIFGTNLRTLKIGLIKSGRVQWQKAEETRKDFNIALTRQDKKFFISELFNIIQDGNLIDPSLQDIYINSKRFLRVHLSYWMCNQFTLHHEFRIDTGRTKFKQGKTDSILHGCESHGQGTQRSVQACMVQAENVEKTPRHDVLGR